MDHLSRNPGEPMAIRGIVICMQPVFPVRWLCPPRAEESGGSAPESSEREWSRRAARWRNTMTGFKMLILAALISTISLTSALAGEPAAFQAQFPNRDVLNGGELTPA